MENENIFRILNTFNKKKKTMKNFHKHMSEQENNIDKYNELTFDECVGYLALFGLIIWIFRWPVLFIIFLLTNYI